MKHVLTILIILCFSFKLFGNNKSQLSSEDREKIILIAEKINSLDERLKSTNDKFIYINEKIDSLEKIANIENQSQNDKLDFSNTLIYFVLGAIMSLIGFILWDRRTALKPIEQETRELKDKSIAIISTLKTIADNNIQLVEVLKSLKNHGNNVNENYIDDFQMDVEELMNSPIFEEYKN